MGIQNYLKRVSKATKDIKSAIEEKGVSVAQCDGFETLANKVRAIQTGTSSDGSSLFTVLAFKSSQTKPATPTGGSFTTSAISYPSGWSDGSGLSKYVWMSYIVFKGDGSVYKNWVSPILVNGIINDGGDPIDLTDLATRTWVTDQIKNAIKNGVIDLSAYATKSYVDQKISEIPGGGGNFVESINGATGAITFAGSGVSKSGNTFTFNSGSGSGTTTSINGETGELTFTGSGVSKNGKTFTFSGGSSTGVTKDYVDTQDAYTLKSAKDYADGLVKEAGVASLNGLKGDVTISAGENITIEKTGNDLTISASGTTTGTPGEPGKDGDTYAIAQLFIAHDSYEIAPEVPSVTSTYNKETRTVINPPTGWNSDATKTLEKPYIWTIWGTFSETTGNQVDKWSNPKCITGAPGPSGEDGDEIEEVFALSDNTTIPTLTTSGTDSNGKTKSDDGFLPKFVFTDETVEATSTRPSVSSEKRYLYGSKRKKHNNVWLDFSPAYLVGNFLKAGLTDKEIADIKASVSKDITASVNSAEKRVADVEARVNNIDGPDATFFVDKQNAIISAITEWSEENRKSFGDLTVNAKEADIKVWAGNVVDEKTNGMVTKQQLTDAGIDLDGKTGILSEWTTYQEKTNQAVERLGSAESRLDAQQGEIDNCATYTYLNKNYDNKEATTTKVSNMAKQTLNAAKAEIASTVATGIWVWALLDNTNDQNNDFDTNPNYTLVGNVLATKTYDTKMFLNWMDAAGTMHYPGVDGEPGFAPTYDSDGKLLKSGEENYRLSIEGKEEIVDNKLGKWHRIIEAKALSRIIQQPGKIDLSAVGESNSLARIVLDATKEKSEVFFDTDTVEFKEGSIINANQLTLRDLTVSGDGTKDANGNLHYGANINKAFINNCEINSCRIWSQIASSNYDPGTETWKIKKGFLFDAGGEEFAIYARSPKCTTEDPDVVISSSEIKLPAATITGQFTAGSADITNLTVNLANVTGLLDAKNIKGKTITADQIATKTITTNELATGVIEGITNDVKSGLTDLKIKADNIDFTGSDGTFIGNLNSQTGLTVDAANINGKLNAEVIEASQADIQGIVKATEINAGKISAGILNVDRLNVEAIYKKMLEADLIAATKIKTVNPNNTGTIEIEKNYIVLTDKNNNVALNVTGNDFAAISAPIQKKFTFTGGAYSNMTDISNDLKINHYKLLEFSGETNTVVFQSANNLLIRLDPVDFYFMPGISYSTPEDIDAYPYGVFTGKIELYANNIKVAAEPFTKYCFYDSEISNWNLANHPNGVADSKFNFPSRLIPASSESDVSIKFKINARCEWNIDHNDMNEFIVDSSITAFQNEVVATTISSAKGVVIGANGFRAALDGENYAQFSTSSTGGTEFLIQAGGTSGYGINVKKDGIQMKLAGVWYAVKRGSDGNLQLN